MTHPMLQLNCFSFVVSDMDSWPEEIVPIPVKFELAPIVNLFTKENLDERHGIRCVKNRSLSY